MSSNLNTKAIVAYLTHGEIMESHKKEKSEKRARKLEKALHKTTRKVRKLEEKLQVIRTPEAPTPKAPVSTPVVEAKTETPAPAEEEGVDICEDPNEWNDLVKNDTSTEEATAARHRALCNSFDMASQDPQAGAIDEDDEDANLPEF